MITTKENPIVDTKKIMKKESKHTPTESSNDKQQNQK